MPEALAASKWSIDPAHTLVEFAVKHMMLATVKGRFRTVEGTLEANPADLTRARIHVTMDAGSIDTGDPQRDQHLRSPDFFDVEKFPQITFASKAIQLQGEGAYRLVGDLTMHGITQEIVLDAALEGQGKDPWGNQRLGFSAEGKLNRKDYGLQWNVPLEAGGILVGEQVKLSIQVEAVQQPA